MCRNSSSVEEMFLPPLPLLSSFPPTLQVHNVVGSFDFLGDPVGLLSNLSTGVKDFFYEPIEGLKPDGKGFLYGLGKGGTSLVSNTMQVGENELWHWGYFCLFIYFHLFPFFPSPPLFITIGFVVFVVAAVVAAV